MSLVNILQSLQRLDDLQTIKVELFSTISFSQSTFRRATITSQIEALSLWNFYIVCLGQLSDNKLNSILWTYFFSNTFCYIYIYRCNPYLFILKYIRYFRSAENKKIKNVFYLIFFFIFYWKEEKTSSTILISVPPPL